MAESHRQVEEQEDAVEHHLDHVRRVGKLLYFLDVPGLDGADSFVGLFFGPNVIVHRSSIGIIRARPFLFNQNAVFFSELWLLQMNYSKQPCSM